MKLIGRAAEGLTYSNVVATIALVLALGGGSFAVAAALKKDSVGTKQIQAKAVKNKELANGAVTSKKLANGAVTSAKLAAAAVTAGALADNSVTGAKVDEPTLEAVPEATKALNVISAVVKADGSLTQATQAGTTSTRAETGIYIVDFNRNVTACTSVAAIGNVDAPVPPSVPPTPLLPFPGAPQPGFAGTSRALGNDEAVRVVTRSPNSPFGPEDHNFELVTVC